MHRVLTILLAIGLAAIGLLSYLLLSENQQPSVSPDAGAPTGNASDQAAPGSNGKGESTTRLANGGALSHPTSSDTSPSRNATGDTAAPSHLIVRVETTSPGLGADLEISARIGARNPAFATTDSQATARFEFELPDGPTTAFVSAAAGPALAVDLAPGGHRKLVLKLEPIAFAVGRVITSHGRSVGDAELVALADHAEHPGEPDPLRVPLRIGRSRPDGTFRVPLFGAGYLGARHRDFAPATMQHSLTLPRDPTTGIARVDFELGDSRPRLGGLVVDGVGRAAPLAQVRLTPRRTARAAAPMPGPPVQLTTDRHGRFETTALPGGPCDVEVLAPTGDCAAITLEVPANQPGDWRIRIGRPAIVHGQARTGSGAGVPAVIRFGRPADLLFQEIQTRDDGTYELGSLPPGRRQLSARPRTGNGHQPARREVTESLTLAAAETTQWDPMFPLSGTGIAVHGRVRDEHDRALARWTVVARQHEPARTVQVMTDLSGRFEVPCDADSRFDLLVYAPNAPATGFAAATRRDVQAAPGPVLLVARRDVGGSTITGRLRSRAGDPVPGKISCWHHERQQTVHLAAKADGGFELTNIPPGTAILFFTYNRFVAPARQLELTAGQRLELGTITMAQGASVSGQVARLDGTFPDQLELAILTADEGTRLPGGYIAGEYRFGSVPAGRHRLLINGPGIASAAVDLDVTAGTDLQQDIRVLPGIERTIQISSPLGDAGWVSLALRQPGQPYTALLGRPLPASRMIEFVACMTPGTWQAIAWDAAGREARANVTFAAGAAAPIRLELQSR